MPRGAPPRPAGESRSAPRRRRGPDTSPAGRTPRTGGRRTASATSSGGADRSTTRRDRLLEPGGRGAGGDRRARRRGRSGGSRRGGGGPLKWSVGRSTVAVRAEIAGFEHYVHSAAPAFAARTPLRFLLPTSETRRGSRCSTPRPCARWSKTAEASRASEREGSKPRLCIRRAVVARASSARAVRACCRARRG